MKNHLISIAQSVFAKLKNKINMKLHDEKSFKLINKIENYFKTKIENRFIIIRKIYLNQNSFFYNFLKILNNSKK